MANKLWLGNDSGNEGDLNVAANWSPSGVPESGDNVTFPAGAADITDSLTALNASTLSGGLGAVIFEDGFSGTVGSETANMQFTCSRFEFSGSGVAYIDLEASAIAPTVRNTAATGQGFYGLSLIGSALTTLNIIGGSVIVAGKITETAAVGTIRIVGQSAICKCGSGVSLTTFYQTGGLSYLHCAATTVTIYGGELYTREVGAFTTLNVRGGTAYPESTGTITTCNADAGNAIFTGSGAARTVTTLKQNPGATVIYDPAVLTVTNISAPDYPISLAATEA